ncbi:MAG TPA: flagellar hook-length control protein FliK [Acidobacteriaceae bacterium]
MRISAESVNQAKQNAEHRVDEKKTSDRFSQLLKSKTEKSKEKQVGSKEDGGDAQKKNPLAGLDLASMNALAADASASRLPQPSVAADPGKIAQPGASVPPEIDRLTTEMGHQIDIFRQGGKAEALNITFDSKTLEGLQVQIRQQEGELGIRFVTQSDNVSKLLSRHTGELREALMSKGVKIRNIAISNARTSPVMQRNERAGV